MTDMIHMIYARSMSGIIGRRDGSIPFHSSADMKRFRELTKDAAVIVGRKTYETLPQLPGRMIFVLTRDALDGVTHDSDPDNLLALARGTGRNVFIIGGAEVYKTYEGIATRVYETIYERPVHSMDGDVCYTFTPKDHAFIATIVRADRDTLFRDYVLE